MKYLTVEQVLRIHARAIERFGGDAGVRDLAMLESAVAQPRARFGGKNLHPNLADKAAALAFSLAMNHPFVDGNKRTAYGAMSLFLTRNGYSIAASMHEREAMFLTLAAGQLSREDVVAWVGAWIVKK